MKLEYLREYKTLAEELNFSSAASRLFVSQSTLSRHIAIMEEEIGSRLLQRSSHHVELTPFGQMVYQKSCTILREYDSMFLLSEKEHELISGELSVGILYYSIAEYYGQFLDQFRETYPKINLEIRNYHPHYLYQDLQQKKLDVGDIFYARQLAQNGLHFQKCYSIRMIAMLRSDHPLARNETLDIRELTDLTRIDLSDDLVSDICTKEIIRRCGVLFKNVEYAKDIESVPAAIRKYNGVHITGERVKRQAYPNIAYITLSNREAFATHCFAFSEDNTNPVIPIFMNSCKKYFEERQEF